MASLYRFFEHNEENLDAIRNCYIFLFSAKKWAPAGEFDFEIDIGTDDEYKDFLTKKLQEGFGLIKNDGQDYFVFRECCIAKLIQYNKLDYFDTPIEFDVLLDILFDEAKTEQGIRARKDAIRNNFFEKTGISCFTADHAAISNSLHWNLFAGYGTGFCVEYNYEMLAPYFLKSKRFVVGDFVNYQDKLPVLRNDITDTKEVEENYRKILFSLNLSFKDEKEFRLAKIYRKKMLEKDEERKEQIPRKAILSITLGSEINEEHATDIQNFFQTALPAAKVYRMQEQFETLFRYKLNF